MKHENCSLKLGIRLTMQKKLQNVFLLIPVPFIVLKKECAKLVLSRQGLLCVGVNRF